MTSGLGERSWKAWNRVMFHHTTLETDLQPSEVNNLATNDGGHRYLISSRVRPSSGAMCRMLCPLNAMPRSCPGTTALSLNHQHAESRRIRECYVTEVVPLAQLHAELGTFTQRHGLGDKTAREKPRQRMLPDVLQEIGRL